MNDIQSLSHSKWRCQYHIVFAAQYWRQEIFGKIKGDIGQILRKLCEQKNVEIIEAEACPDHIHMLVCIPRVQRVVLIRSDGCDKNQQERYAPLLDGALNAEGLHFMGE